MLLAHFPLKTNKPKNYIDFKCNYKKGFYIEVLISILSGKEPSKTLMFAQSG